MLESGLRTAHKKTLESLLQVYCFGLKHGPAGPKSSSRSTLISRPEVTESNTASAGPCSSSPVGRNRIYLYDIKRSRAWFIKNGPLLVQLDRTLSHDDNLQETEHGTSQNPHTKGLSVGIVAACKNDASTALRRTLPDDSQHICKQCSALKQDTVKSR
jgi:hypothetical protein